MIYTNLCPEKALIWRIMHRDNIPWVLGHGLHCPSSRLQNSRFVAIGNADLIDKRRTRPVPISPGGMLADYVPFYFTPFSVMLLNIKSGRGVPQRRNDEIVIMVSSVHHLVERGRRVIFTDAHAFPVWTNYYEDPADLARIDWPLLQRRDFKRDPDDLKKIERYQAEALVHGHLPASDLLGIITYNDQGRNLVQVQVDQHALSIPVHARPGWYF